MGNHFHRLLSWVGGAKVNWDLDDMISLWIQKVPTDAKSRHPFCQGHKCCFPTDAFFFVQQRLRDFFPASVVLTIVRIWYSLITAVLTYCCRRGGSVGQTDRADVTLSIGGRIRGVDSGDLINIVADWYSRGQVSSTLCSSVRYWEKDKERVPRPRAL